uniref:Cation efflux protein cytoplasmic domain-containing protein n=1 Tax=Parascaris univalens TaxID=6257 RepID=A0A915ALD0_PARUN
GLLLGMVKPSAKLSHHEMRKQLLSRYLRLNCSADMANEKLLSKSISSNGSSSSSLCVMQSHVSPTIVKNPKKVSKFYQKQSDLVESYKRDSTIIEESQRRRQKAHSISRSVASEKDMESGKLIVEESQEEKDARKVSSVESIRRPRISYFRRQHSGASTKRQPGVDKAAKWLAMATLIVNISLVTVKAAAAYLSGSLSIISSLVDSTVDITSGLVIWLTARAIKKRDPYMYPRGRTRLEPLALIIVSVIMGVASVQMVVQSLESVLRQTVDPHVDLISLFIMVTTVLVKFILMLLCRKFDDPSINVLAQDHRNDCISNIVALLCAWAASKFWIYLDPIGAIIVSVYIAITWYFTGKEHLAMLSGKSAAPEFINRIVKVCVEHDERIDFIDTVYVYHFGTRFLVEVHIVLDKNMTLQKAHDISEALQTNIESLDEVERAFVHCDYEYSHMPADEHKVV